MPSVRTRWKEKQSSHSTSSSSSSANSSNREPPPPPEFVCPVSSSLMADPVIIPSGQSFDRPCIEACRHFSFPPPSAPDLDFSSPKFLLIPNIALSSAILNWCRRSNLLPPLPISEETAFDLVRNLMPTTSSSSSSSSDDDDVAVAVAIAIAATAAAEEEMVKRLKHPQISVRDSALLQLRHSSRESSEKRLDLCTHKLLSALLLSHSLPLQANAVASIVNLSIEPVNKIKIVRSGAVPPLIDALKNGKPDSRDNAAGAIFSLALEDGNRLAIGALGAVPPLLRLFNHIPASHRARKEAGMAIYYLTLAASNSAKLAKLSGAARAVLGIAAGNGAELSRVAMMIIRNMAERPEGRVALMDAGAVETLVGMMKRGGTGNEEGHCIGMLYELSRGSLRFRASAKAAGAEEALMKVDGNGEMVRRVLKVVRGEKEGRRVVDILADDDEDFGSSSGSH